MNLKNIVALTPEHTEALDWFHANAGIEVTWPIQMIQGMYLANKAKGIHKPAGMTYALSIRQSMGQHYDNVMSDTSIDTWEFQYRQEGSDPKNYTNSAMAKCLADNVPIGVLLQTKQKPQAAYKVLGLGLITDYTNGSFTIKKYDSDSKKIDATKIVLPSDAFDASDSTDARIKQLKSIATRRGQPAFREALLNAYEGMCAISGCAVKFVLEAAHIAPYRGLHTNHVTNGILLRADLHTLFDLGLLRIEPETCTVLIDREIRDQEYTQFHNCKLRAPTHPNCSPDRGALRLKFEEIVE